MNIPARYCTGYLGDIGAPPPYWPNGFPLAGSKFIWAGGGNTFDPRNYVPRIGRVLNRARARDEAGVPITHTFGPNTFSQFLHVTQRG
jgi:transglutaminase-like putative cysteine protease